MDDFPKGRSHGSGSSHGYTVEARIDNEGKAKVVGELTLGPAWVQVPFHRSPIGVPQGAPLGAGNYTDLLSYPAAQALRWWLHALDPYATGLETRLVKHQLEYTYKETSLEASEAVRLGPGGVAPVQGREP